jgi:hypothetical protein
LFTAGHFGLAALARQRGARVLVGPLVRGLARLTRRMKAPRAHALSPTASELGQIWQGYLPSKKAVPIVSETEEVVHAEIRTYCPLRGTGDHGACHALMGYDRALLAAHGGSFEVVRSQAEPGVEVCLVALRPGVAREG